MVGPWLCDPVRTHTSGLVAGIRPEEMRCEGLPVPAEEVNRILVIRPGGLGDAALTLPVISSLHKFYQWAKIDVLAERRNADVYRMSQLTNEIYLFDQKPLATVRQLRRIGYDIVVDTEQFHHFSAVIANVLRPTCLCGFNTLGRTKFQTHPVAYSDYNYEVFSFLKLHEALTGLPAQFDPNKPFIDVPSESQDWGESVLAFLGSRALATIMPSAMSAYRFWPADRYRKIVDWLIDRGFYVVVLGGTDAVQASHIMTEGLNREDVLDLAGRTTLPQSAALIQRARVYISADTGVLHLACGLGTPTVSLFGPGNYKKWAPLGSQHVMVRKDMHCSPCTRMGYTPNCPRGVMCMDAISVDDVITAVKTILGQ